MAELLDAVRDLAPLITRQGDRIEAERGLPVELDHELTQAGCYRMASPRDYGGLELSWRELVTVVAQLARADGSVGWTVGQNAQSQGMLAAFPGATRDAVFGTGPDVRAAGAVAPKGRANGDGTQWLVTGRWPFVTGCRSARWLYLNALVLQGRSLVVDEAARPRTRMVAVPAGAVDVVDTWSVLGLRGTGSHDVQVRAVPVPDQHTLTIDPADPASGPALRRVAAAGLTVAACAVGLAEGAVDELAGFAAAGRRQSFSPTRMSASPLFQESLGNAWSTARAARALLEFEADRVDAGWVEAGADPGGAGAGQRERAALRAGVARVMSLALDAVRLAHQAAGGAGVYDTMPLQRRLRDAQTAAAHVVAGRGFALTMGAQLAGEDLPPGTA